MESRLEAWKHERQNDMEMFRSGITYGAMSLKALLIVNGGAATVLLAFISRVETEDGVGSKLVIGLAPSMESFVAGLIFCVIAIGSTYMTQSCYQHDHLRFGIIFMLSRSQDF